MRIGVKIVTNEEQLKVNDYKRQLAVEHNFKNPYNKVVVPKVPKPKYKKTYMGIKQENIIDFWLDINKEKDIRINVHPRGELIAEYDPMLESKLETIFKWE